MKITVLIFYMVVILICTVVSVNAVVKIVDNVKEDLNFGIKRSVPIIGMFLLAGWFGWLLFEIVQI